MSLLDKAKVAAEKAAARAQQGVQQGQAKIEELQEKRKADALLRDLGAAYFAEERSGGDHEAVVRALAAVDAHVAENGGLDGTGSEKSSDGETPESYGESPSF